MNYKNFNLRFLPLIVLMLLPMFAGAVTQKEMEQARTIAAKAYLRYANDGSGYLDDLNPTTMAELEASLKNKEKENIKAFKAIPVPSDYGSWDKEKLVEYWAVTAFQDKGLLEKGRGGRIRARSQINKMNIAAVAPAETTKPAAQSQAPAPSAAENVGQAADSLLNNPEVLDPELQQQEEDLDNLNIDKATNYTWVYIMVLGILVAIVIALVVYAANVMKKNGGNSQQDRQAGEAMAEAEEHYESLMADKDVEIAMLKKKLDHYSKQNTELTSKIEALMAELKALKEQSGRINKDSESTKLEEPRETKPVLRSIFLGRANARGIFVRADRTLNVGNSVFVLETSDGFSGSFKVADSQAAWSLALSNPKEYLESACTGHDLNDTLGVSKIVTESSGTAVFEGGCWRVIRKARIRYE